MRVLALIAVLSGTLLAQTPLPPIQLHNGGTQGRQQNGVNTREFRRWTLTAGPSRIFEQQKDPLPKWNLWNLQTGQLPAAQLRPNLKLLVMMSQRCALPLANVPALKGDERIIQQPPQSTSFLMRMVPTMPSCGDMTP
jgi:hypothetical protein